MSGASDASPQVGSGIGIGTVVRLLAIALGIMSAVLLARSAFGIRFDEDFLLFLTAVRDIVGVVVLPFELILVKPAVRWLHEHGLTFELHEHWRNAFVLLWLFNASRMRYSSPLSHFLGDSGPGAVVSALRWVWTATAALIGGVLSGTVPLDHPAVLWWAVGAYFLNRSGDDFITAGAKRVNAALGVLALVATIPFLALALGWLKLPSLAGTPPLFWWAIGIFFAFRSCNALILVAAGRAHLVLVALWLALASVTMAFALGLLGGPKWLAFEQSPSPGLANLAVFVAFLGSWYLLRAFLKPEEGEAGFISRALGMSEGRTALDILAVLGGAAFIVWLGHALA